MSEVKQVKLAGFLENNYFQYGNFINHNRVIPGSDGLKKVHRRVLLALRDVANGKLVSTVNVVGDTQKRHPYGTASIEGTIAEMARINAIDGQGAFGIKLLESVPAAASRYTKVGLTKEQAEYWFKLTKYAPIVEGDVDYEPEYLIAPVPYCLVFGGLNWGLGVMGRTPAFTYESLIEAYLANDPTLLEPQFGYKLNKNTSQLKEIWETGYGRLDYSFSLTKLNESNFYITGSGELFTPAMEVLKKHQDANQIVITNESSDQIAIKISRAYRVSPSVMDEVWKSCKLAASKSRNFNIIAVIDGKIRSIGIKEWLDITIGRYKEAFEKSRQDRIAQLKKNIEVLNYLPQVGRLILDEKTDAQIIKAVKGLTEEILAAIKKKSIGSLRKSDYSKEIAVNEEAIKLIEKEDVMNDLRKGFK